MKKSRHPLIVVGWREWVQLPDLGVRAIKAKVDTGAKSSSIHAYDVELYRRDGQEIVRFKVCPYQHDERRIILTEHPLLEYREVRSSNGQTSCRPVISTMITLHGVRREIELTLASRDQMGFRMLLGREALRHQFIVNPSRSYCGGKPSHA